MLTFKEFLAKKFSEVNLTPQQVGKAIQNLTGASDSNVGPKLADADIDTAVKVALAPKTQQAMAIYNAKKTKLQPNQMQPNVNSIIPPTMGSMSMPGMT